MIQSKAIRTLVESFVNDIQDLLLADLINNLAELTSGKLDASRVGSSALAGAPSGSRSPGSKRSSEELEALTKALRVYIGKHPGERIEEIATGMAVSTKDLQLPVKKLQALKKITTKGMKRATSYWPKA